MSRTAAMLIIFCLLLCFISGCPSWETGVCQLQFGSSLLWRVQMSNSCEDFRWSKLWINTHQCYIFLYVI